MKEKLEGNDRLYGWKFGCDGWVNATEAGRILNLHTSYVCELLRELEVTAVKRPTNRTWPLRAGRPSTDKGKGRSRCGSAWRVCLRSVNEYAKRREPVEV